MVLFWVKQDLNELLQLAQNLICSKYWVQYFAPPVYTPPASRPGGFALFAVYFGPN